MRLKCIKLAGFKSFVNPTTINFPSNICAIVGPNGCGKSNVIDAVRWVMGESSAHNLRSSQMADVIFEGTSERSAVGLASVELILDNSDKRLQGEYAGYAEISIKRKVERGGESEYLLNNARCRRRDITGLFLGTGLGPRSYSIVEQGMVSRLIESRPEELRVFIEEAAGISRYRERRRETASRIAKTRDNLDRLADRRDELQRQLQHLERQSRAADRYRKLMAQQRLTEARVNALGWRALTGDMAESARKLSGLETRKEAIIARQREEETAIARGREKNEELRGGVSEIQNRSIAIGNNTARIEQDIKHHNESLEKLGQDLENTRSDWRQTREELDSDLGEVARLEAELGQIRLSIDTATVQEQESSRLAAEAENRRQQSEQRWSEFVLAAEQPRQTEQVEQNRISQLQSNLERARKRRKILQIELAGLETGPVDFTAEKDRAAGLEKELGDLRERLGKAAQVLASSRKLLEASGGELDRVRAEARRASGRKASLDALQQAALGDDDAALAEWRKRHGLEDRARLGETLEIAPGWEAAVELVLGDRLRGIPVKSLSADLIRDLPDADLTLLDLAGKSSHGGQAGLPELAGKLNRQTALGSLLWGVYIAESLDAALAVRSGLAPGESVITAEGVWAGADWVQISKADSEQSVILRQSALDTLGAEIASLEEKSQSLARKRDGFRESQAKAEQERESCLEQIQQKSGELNRVRAGIDSRKSQIENDIERSRRIAGELKELQDILEQDQASLAQAEQGLESAREQISADASRREQHRRDRDRDREQLVALRNKALGDRQVLHDLALKQNQLATQRDSTRQNMDRMAVQVQRAAERIKSLENQLDEATAPGEALQLQLQQKLDAHQVVERELQQARAVYNTAEEKLQERERNRRRLQQELNEVNEEITECRLESNSAATMSGERRKWLERAGLQPEQVLREITGEQTIASCEEELGKIKSRIERIGAVNLAAAEEFEQQSEKKSYLDKQNDELEKALATLEDAMGKIDGETRARFGDTLENINQGLKNLFARLFRGGQAWLELTGGDLLNAGVSIMARPPGKKIQGIMQLSGGEKAMTAIALVFTIFQLNPSPFCMLDEVDAPLDVDNNNRFITLLREMSANVQFILVTHKTITMESASQLLGITMQEAGISRLVSVDIDEAVELVEA